MIYLFVVFFWRFRELYKVWLRFDKEDIYLVMPIGRMRIYIAWNGRENHGVANPFYVFFSFFL